MSNFIDNIVKDAATGKLAVMDLPGPHPGCRPNAKYLSQAQPPADLSANTGQPSCEYHRPGKKASFSKQSMSDLMATLIPPISLLAPEGQKTETLGRATALGTGAVMGGRLAGNVAGNMVSPRNRAVARLLGHVGGAVAGYGGVSHVMGDPSWAAKTATPPVAALPPKQASFIDELIKEADMYGYDPRMMRYAGRNPYMAQAMFNPNTMRQGVQGQQDLMRTQSEVQQQMMAKQFEIEKQRRGLDMAVGGGGGGMGGYGSYMGYGGMPGGMNQFFGGGMPGGVMPGYGPPGGPHSNMPPQAGPPGADFMNPYMYNQGGADPRTAQAEQKFKEAEKAHQDFVHLHQKKVEGARDAFMAAAGNTSGGNWIDPTTGAPVAQASRWINGGNSVWGGKTKEFSDAENAYNNYIRLHNQSEGIGNETGSQYWTAAQQLKAKRDQMKNEYDQARAGLPGQHAEAQKTMREDQLYNRGQYEKQLEGNRNLQQQRMQMGQSLMNPGQPQQQQPQQQPQQPAAPAPAPAAPAPAPAAPAAPGTPGHMSGGFKVMQASFVDDLVKSAIYSMAVPMAGALGGAALGGMKGPPGFEEDAAERGAIMGGAAGIGGMAGHGLAGHLGSAGGWMADKTNWHGSNPPVGKLLGGQPGGGVPHAVPLGVGDKVKHVAGKIPQAVRKAIGPMGGALGALAALAAMKGMMPKAPWQKGPTGPPGVIESWMGGSPPAPPAGDNSVVKLGGYEVQAVNPFKSHHNGQPEFGRKRKPLQAKPIGNSDGPDLSEMDEHMQALHLRKHSALIGFTPGAASRLGVGAAKSKLTRIEDTINKFRGLGSAPAPAAAAMPPVPVAPVAPAPVAGLSSSRFLSPEAQALMGLKTGAAAELALAASKSW